MRPSRVNIDDLAKRHASKEVMLLVEARIRRIGRDVAGQMVPKALMRDLCDLLTAVAQPLRAAHATELAHVDFVVTDIVPGDADGMVGASLWMVPRDGKPITKHASHAVRQGVRKALSCIEARTYADSADLFAPSADMPGWLIPDEAWRRGLGPMSRAARRGKQPLHLIAGDADADVLSPTPIPPAQPELVRQVTLHGVVDAYKRSREVAHILGHEGETPTNLVAKQRTFVVKIPSKHARLVLAALQDAQPRAWLANVLMTRSDGWFEVIEYVLA
jgi:hypothetical protein